MAMRRTEEGAIDFWAFAKRSHQLGSHPYKITNRNRCPVYRHRRLLVWRSVCPSVRSAVRPSIRLSAQPTPKRNSHAY